jgi:hypothetical protein
VINDPELKTNVKKRDENYFDISEKTTRCSLISPSINNWTKVGPNNQLTIKRTATANIYKSPNF